MHRQTGPRSYYQTKFLSMPGVDTSAPLGYLASGFMPGLGTAGSDRSVLRVTNTADVTLTTGLVLAFDTVLQDNLGEWTADDYSFTPQASGQYVVAYTGICNSTGESQYANIYLYGNAGGSEFASVILFSQAYSVSTSAGLARFSPVFGIGNLSAGTRYYAKVSSSNNALTRKACTGFTELSIHRVR